MLQNVFSEFCLFFYDKYGGRYITVVWKPAAFVPQPFKVSSIPALHSVYHCAPMCVVNGGILQVVKAFCKTKAVNQKDTKKVKLHLKL